ncbi:MAG: DNA alkylation repair protein [Ruminococcus sp.]|nr:DNA alkylation repair protein [Ruminococcus sp.]
MDNTIITAIKSAEDITAFLFKLKDEKYKKFTATLTPSVCESNIIGVRVPQLRSLAKKLKGTSVADEFMCALPHAYLEENHLHGYLIEFERDFDTCIEKLEKFLPYIDNWATCDTVRPKIFKKHKPELLPYIEKWIKSEHTYTVRYAIGLLLSFYLDDDFDLKHLSMVAKIKSDEYYINMMIAWYFATALAKQYESTLPYIENNALSKWTHNKTIVKACESYRVEDSHKAYLRTLRIK